MMLAQHVHEPWTPTNVKKGEVRFPMSFVSWSFVMCLFICLVLRTYSLCPSALRKTGLFLFPKRTVYSARAGGVGAKGVLASKKICEQT